jgi:hypothetical protein
MHMFYLTNMKMLIAVWCVFFSSKKLLCGMLQRANRWWKENNLDIHVVQVVVAHSDCSLWLLLHPLQYLFKADF